MDRCARLSGSEVVTPRCAFIGRYLGRNFFKAAELKFSLTVKFLACRLRPMNMLRQLLLFGFVILLIGCKPSRELSELENGGKLQQDCARLLTQFQPGDIPKNLWPLSIKQLKPIRVTREDSKIRILVQQEQGKFTVGYDVFSDTRLAPSTQGVWVQKTKFKGVWIFKLPY